MATENLESELLRAFVNVIDCGGFSAAAERLHKTQSTISQRVQRLEDIVGTPLLVRTSRTLSLTPAGKVFLVYARKILLLHQEALQAALDITPEVTLRVGIPEDYAELYLAAVLREYATTHSDVRPDIVCARSEVLVNKVNRGELDAALAVRHPHTGVGELLCDEELVWVAAEGYELDPNAPVPLALFPEGCIFRHNGLTALFDAGVDHRVVYTSQSPRGLTILIDDKAAVGITSRRLTPSHWKIIGTPHLPPIRSAELMLYTPPGAPQGFKKDFISLLSRRVQAAPPADML